MRLVVATRSAHKLAEIRAILGVVPDLEVLDLDQAGVSRTEAEEKLEPYETFEENALSKARYYQERTGLPTVADDSGIAVDALDGAPGVRSKRFAPDEDVDGLARDQANNRHLLRRLEGVPPDARTARYVCVAVMVSPGAEPVVCRGEAPGRIAEAPRGTGGFGYDPLFFDPDLGRTFGEIDADEKHERSHRGRAFRALARHFLSGR
ncbi:MAG TPA: RdgB/HAM1 family non-canonical purine NTP pyrophosphatase [Longimicrobiales bacterium]|nr:RdgB/HAM1 family non-canonical purine NTP pyrophosphatase [Longimicrobiales bacterium]